MTTPYFDQLAAETVQNANLNGRRTPVPLRRVWDLVNRVRVAVPVFGRVTFGWELRATGPVMIIAAQVTDRDLAVVDPLTKERTTISATRYIDLGLVTSLLEESEERALEMLAFAVRDFLKWFVYHEVEEMLIVDGTRRFDSHSNDR